MARNSSGLGEVTTVIALVSGSQHVVVSPKTWKSGRFARIVSFGPNSSTWCMPAMFAAMFRCVSGTAFGSRSLPLVNRMTAWSSSPARVHVADDAIGRHRGAEEAAELGERRDGRRRGPR